MTINVNKPILIYTMEKVGFSTVSKTLDQAGFGVHRAYFGNVRTLDYKNSLIISMVRDPVARCLAWRNERALTGHEFEGMDKAMSFALNWHEQCFRPITGVNVFGVRFPRKKGYRMYAKDRVLVLRTRDLSTVLPKALSEFLQMPEEKFEVTHEAHGKERFGEGYNDDRFEKKWLESVYSTEYCRHFFYMDELKELIKKWSK